jgi:alpha-N-arabinofuranosidase
MSLSRRTFFSLAAAGVASAQHASPKKATLSIELDGSGPTISKHVYGHFAEHLGHCIYGGIWVGPDSPIPNTRGIRNDIVTALRKMQIPNLRWPGGCFADQYDWRAGIGPRGERPRSVNIHWGGVIEDNSFGTHEFLDLCEQCGAEPYVAANVGSGTPREMADWIEYMTHPGDSSLAELRRANGRDKPWQIPFLGVGNENWGCGGNMTADYYADLYRRFAVYARNYGDNKMMRVAGGPSGGDLEWIETLMRRIPSNMEAVSLHDYTIGSDAWSNKGPSTGFDEKGWITILKNALRMETLVSDTEKIMERHDPKGRVKLFVDEWGTWYDPEPGRNPAFLYQENTIRDALVAASTLHIFHNHAKRITLANLAQLVNVLQAPILTDGDKMVLTPTYHLFEMFKMHQDTTALSLELETDYYVHGEQAIPALSASASRSPDGAVQVSLANCDANAPVEVSAELSGKARAKAEGRVLAGAKLDDRNTFADPNRVEPKAFTGASLSGSKLTLSVPPRSVVALTLRS